MLTFLAAVALAGVSAGAQPHAYEEYTKVEGRVSLAGLDLSRPADVAELRERVQRTARHICRRGVHRDLWGSQPLKECAASVVASGHAQLATRIPASPALRLIDAEN